MSDDDHFAISFAETVSFDFLGEELGHDLNAALGLALQANGVFSKAGQPLALFRRAIADAIGQIAGASAGTCLNACWNTVPRMSKRRFPNQRG